LNDVIVPPFESVVTVSVLRSLLVADERVPVEFRNTPPRIVPAFSTVAPAMPDA
jgi:hypothetical protein